MDLEDKEFSYASFWNRLWATIIDIFVIFVIAIVPLFFIWIIMTFFAIYLFDVSYLGILKYFNYIAYISITLYLWHKKQTTIGKKCFDLKIVDAKTYGKPTFKQYIIRLVGYVISFLPLGLGFFWALVDKKNQTLHDKLANTLVIGKREETKKISIFKYILKGLFIFGLFVYISFKELIFFTSLIINQDKFYTKVELDSSIYEKLLEKEIINSDESLLYLKTNSSYNLPLLGYNHNTGVAITSDKIIFYDENNIDKHLLSSIINIEYFNNTKGDNYHITIKFSKNEENIYVTKSKENLKAIENIIELWEARKNFPIQNEIPQEYTNLSLEEYVSKIEENLKNNSESLTKDLIINGYKIYSNEKDTFFKYNDKIFKIVTNTDLNSSNWIKISDENKLTSSSFNLFIQGIKNIPDIFSKNEKWKDLAPIIQNIYLYFMEQQLEKIKNSNIDVSIIKLYQKDGTTLEDKDSSRRYIISEIYKDISNICEEDKNNLCKPIKYLEEGFNSSALNPDILFSYAYETSYLKKEIELLESFLEITKVSDELFNFTKGSVYNNLGYAIYLAKETKKFDKALEYLNKAKEEGFLFSVATISSIHKYRGDYELAFKALKPIAYQFFHASDEALKEEDENHYVVINNLISTSYEFKDYNTTKFVCDRYSKIYNKENEDCFEYLKTIDELSVDKMPKPKFSFWNLYTNPEEYISESNNKSKYESNNKPELLEKFEKLYAPNKVPNTLKELIKIEEKLGKESYVTSFYLKPQNKIDFFYCTFNCEDEETDEKTDDKIFEYLLPLAHIDGTGGVAALWLNNGENTDLENAPIIAFGSEGAIKIVAKNLKDFLFMLSFGGEALDGEFYESVDYAEAYYREPNFMEYRKWLQDVMNIEPLKDWKGNDTPKEIYELQKEASNLYELSFFEFLHKYLPNNKELASNVKKEGDYKKLVQVKEQLIKFLNNKEQNLDIYKKIIENEKKIIKTDKSSDNSYLKNLINTPLNRKYIEEIADISCNYSNKMEKENLNNKIRLNNCYIYFYKNLEDSEKIKMFTLNLIKLYEKEINNKNIILNDLVNFYYYIGDLYYDINEMDNAIKYYKNIEVADENIITKINIYKKIANIYSKTNNYSEALNYFFKAIDLTKRKLEKSEIYFEIAKLYEKTNNKNEAIRYARKAYVSSEVDSDLYNDAKTFIEKLKKEI